jgi:hypothetical protein
MGVGGQRHTLVALSPGKGPLPIVKVKGLPSLSVTKQKVMKAKGGVEL